MYKVMQIILMSIGPSTIRNNDVTFTLSVMSNNEATFKSNIHKIK